MATHPPTQAGSPAVTGAPGEPSGPAAATPARTRRLAGLRRRALVFLRDPLVLTSLGIWCASRFAVALLGWGTAWISGGPDKAPPAFASLWDWWDERWYTEIARFGYFNPHHHYGRCCEAAFFPGQPVVLRLAYDIVRDWVLAGLVVSFVAGAVAVVALARLAAAEAVPNGQADSRERGRRAVLYLVLMPYAVFLFAGYTEALFLAFALPGWLAARRGRWWLAGTLVALSASVRITGLLLGAGLVVEYAVARRRSGLPVLSRPAWALALSPLPVLAYFSYLYAHTGDWFAWQTAERVGWHRTLSNPVSAFRRTWHVAGARLNNTYVLAFRAEILAVAIALLLLGALIVARRWGEATYVGLSLAVLVTSTIFYSVPRSLLLLFPLYLLVARLTINRRWLHGVLVWSMAPMMAILTIAFTRGAWVN